VGEDEKRITIKCRLPCTNEPVSLFKISVIVNARIIHIYLYPFSSTGIRWVFLKYELDFRKVYRKIRVLRVCK